MSLILDALKKLERDKQGREPGVVVVGSVPWQGVRRGRGRLVLGLAALAVAVVVAGAWWLARTKAPAPRGGPAAAEPAAAGRAVGPTQPAPGAPTSMPPGAAAADTPVSAPAPRQLAIPGAGGVGTPAAPAAAATLANADLQLNAISERDGHAVALIGGRLVREGDSFDGVRVLRIGEAEVELEVRGQRRVLRF